MLKRDAGGGPEGPEYIFASRRPLLAAAAAAVAGAAGGAGQSVFIAGEAGVGKSTVLSHLRSLDPRFRTVAARGVSIEADLPLALLDQLGLVDPAVLARVAEDPGGPLTVYRHLVESVRVLASGSPLLIAIDDLHWADPVSLRGLTYLARRLEGLPVALVATLRHWPPDAIGAARALVDYGAGRLLSLDPLTRTECGEMVSLLGGPADESTTARVFELSKGNPFLIRTAVLGSGSDHQPGLRGTLGAPRILAANAPVLITYLSGLPAPAVACAHVLSILRSPASPALLATATGLSLTQVVPAIDVLSEAGVLVGTGASLELCHDLLASAIEEDLSPGLKRLYAGRLFNHYHDMGDLLSAARIAFRAPVLGDSRAVDALRHAAGRARSNRDFRRASDYLAAACESAGPTSDPTLRLEAAEADLNAGRFLSSRRRFLEIEDLELDDATGLRVQLGLARCEIGLGDREAGLARLVRVGASGDSSAVTAAAIVEALHMIWQIRGPREVLEASDSGLGLMNPATRPTTLDLRALCELELGDPRGLGLIDRLFDGSEISEAAPVGFVASRANIMLLRVNAAVMAEHFDQALALAALGEKHLRQAGAPNQAVIPLRLTSLFMPLARGHLPEVLARVAEMSDELDVDTTWMPYLMSAAAEAQLGLGDFAGAERSLRRAGTGRIPYRARFELLRSAGRLHYERGELAESCSFFEEAEALTRDMGFQAGYSVWADAALQAYLAAGRLAQAEQLLSWVEESTAALGTTWPRLVADTGRGELAALAGDRHLARTHFLKVEECQTPFERTRHESLVVVARWALRWGEVEKARRLARDVCAWAEERGLMPLLGRATEILREGGGRRRAGREAGTLSRSQMTVAQAAITGATTREIAAQLHLSPRTVDSHLAQIYKTLGVSGRVELRQRPELLYGRDLPAGEPEPRADPAPNSK